VAIECDLCEGKVRRTGSDDSALPADDV